MEHIWTILMLKILHAHLLRTFVANSKIDAIYVLYPESLSDKYLAVWKVFAFSDSAYDDGTNDHHQYTDIYIYVCMIILIICILCVPPCTLMGGTLPQVTSANKVKVIITITPSSF